MRNLKFPILKCCQCLYQSAVSAGLLFVLYGFLQTGLAKLPFLPEASRLLSLITAGTLAAQLLILWPVEKGYRLQLGLGLLGVHIAAGLLFMRHGESFSQFWTYVGLEAACIAASAAVYALRHTRLLKGLLIAGEAISLIVLTFWGRALPIWCVGIMLTAFLLFLVESRAADKQEALGLLPFFAAAMLVLCLVPQKERPMDWSWAKNACTAIQEKAEMLTVDLACLFQGKSGFSFSGYGNTGAFGGSVFDSDRAQLRITGSRTKNPLYLTGQVLDVYTGADWQALPHPVDAPGTLGILQALDQSIYAHQKDELTASCFISVEYLLIKTQDLFHELNTTSLYGDIPPLQAGSAWIMDAPQEKGFSYQLRFLEVNESSDAIQALYRQQAWKDNAIWEEALSEYEAEVYKTNTALPEQIPQRVYELAHSLAAGADNDYDRMAAFARYLQTYTYTKTPPACPDGQELTDYFLFDSKSGYCAYFATALAVLGRCQGIPTRYVQGFMTADAYKSTYLDLTITGMQTHAWTEFYLPHIGWVRMEATPGFGDCAPERWQPKESSGALSTGAGPSPEGIPQSKPDPTPTPQDGPALTPTLPLKASGRYAPVLFKIGAVLGAGCVLAAITFLFRALTRRRRYIRAKDLEKTQFQLKRLLRLGRLLGVPIEDGETLPAYEIRARARLDTEEYAFLQACTLYEGARFGAKAVSPEDLRALEAYAQGVERGYLAGCGFFKRLLYRVL